MPGLNYSECRTALMETLARAGIPEFYAVGFFSYPIRGKIADMLVDIVGKNGRENMEVHLKEVLKLAELCAYTQPGKREKEAPNA